MWICIRIIVAEFKLKIFNFFCCKQKTAYEMLISDWISDVCSSDLLPGLRVSHAIIQATKAAPCRNQFESLNDDVAFDTTAADGAFENSVVADHQMGYHPPRRRPPGLDHCGKRDMTARRKPKRRGNHPRTEGRRVGKECVKKWRTR